MKKRLAIIFAILVCAFLPAVSNGQLITISIEAVVTGVTDNDNLLEGKVTIGGTITGTYTYDTSTLDTNPLSGTGNYWYYVPPCGITLTIEDFVFGTNFGNVEFVIGITDTVQGVPGDAYWLHNYNNLQLSNNVEVDAISWQLNDYGGIALTSTALPTTAPVLSDWGYNTLSISGGIGGIPPCYEKTFGIGANVVSAVLVPEPISLYLFGFGLLTIRFCKK
jgi:hypothetical protein